WVFGNCVLRGEQGAPVRPRYSKWLLWSCQPRLSCLLIAKALAAVAAFIGPASLATAQGTLFEDSFLVFSPLTVIRPRTLQSGPSFQTLVAGQTKRDEVRASLGEPTATQGNEDTWQLTTVCRQFALTRMMARYGADDVLAQLMFEMARPEALAEVCSKLRLDNPSSTQQAAQGEIRVFRQAGFAIAVRDNAVTAIWLLVPDNAGRSSGPRAAGAKPERPAPKPEENQALLRAAASGDTATVKALLANGADPLMRDDRGRTPLQLAVAARHREAVEALLDGGAPPHALVKGDTPPLHLAAMAGDQEIAALLLARGAIPFARDKDGDTAADVARSEAIRSLVVEAIAESAARPECAAARGCVTAYLQALRSGDTEALKGLSAPGAAASAMSAGPVALEYEILSVEVAGDVGGAKVQIVLSTVPAPLNQLTAEFALENQQGAWCVANVQVRPSILEGQP
ncbi:MAG TPA: ankyrin repeat domain-containing protein, partial [Terriglobia bacterium]|nr:ankyrin repeat domain-containing protein [Terriglobia bacterium]